MNSLRRLMVAVIALMTGSSLQAELHPKVRKVTLAGQKAVVKLGLRNDHVDVVRVARARVLLLGTNGNVVGHVSRWVIGGHNGLPPLAPGAETNLNVVMPCSGDFEYVHVFFSNVTLADGQSGLGRNATIALAPELVIRRP